MIASDFSAQRELVGAGWLVNGQLEWDPAQHASYFVPYIADVWAKLEEAYKTDLSSMSAAAIEFAQQYDADRVYQEFWQPFIWQERRFPAQSYLTPGFQCPVPATFVRQGNDLVAVCPNRSGTSRSTGP